MKHVQISDLLLEYERVEWSYREKVNIFEKLIVRNVCYPLLIGIPILITILFLSLCFNWEIVFGFAIAFGLFSALFFIVPEVYNYIQIKKTLQLSKMDLRNYKRALYLTNERWIQKSYKVLNIDLKNFPNHQLTRDFFILNHTDIKTIIISTYKKEHTIWVSGKDPEKTIKWENYITFKLPSGQFDELFEKIRKYISLEILDDSIENVTLYISLDK
ncbi:MAG: hypothetical protein BAJALOKI3v1_120004 [Promethearchaeota archaeon]|nr:MAG: hypothetical protein BAJALOKI3v1_120004 [Candidatus Lokiarchaeota archaeon]